MHCQQETLKRLGSLGHRGGLLIPVTFFKNTFSRRPLPLVRPLLDQCDKNFGKSGLGPLFQTSSSGFPLNCGSGLPALSLDFIHMTDPVGQDLHHMMGKVRVLLDEKGKPLGIDLCKARSGSGDHRRPAGRLVDERQFPDDGSPNGLLHYLGFHHDIESALKKDVHAVTRIPRRKKDLTGSQVGGVGLV